MVIQSFDTALLSLIAPPTPEGLNVINMSPPDPPPDPLPAARDIPPPFLLTPNASLAINVMLPPVPLVGGTPPARLTKPPSPETEPP